MRQNLAALLLGLALIGSACSDDNPQSVNADGTDALDTQVVDDKVGDDNGAANDNNRTTSDGGDTVSNTPADDSEPATNNERFETQPFERDANSETGDVPQDRGIPLDPDAVNLAAATSAEIKCFVDDFAQRSGVDLLEGTSADADLANTELAAAIALQSGLHPGPTLLAADGCLSAEARYAVAADTPLLQSFGREQLDCMWPALQLIGEELSSGVTADELLKNPRPEMQDPINQLFACSKS